MKMNNTNTIHRPVFPVTFRLIVLFILFSTAVDPISFSPKAAETPNLEEKTKAAFIYHFTKYIKWPRSDASATFNIGVLGESNIVGPLEEISNLKKVGNRRIVIHQLDSVQQCGPCHILFIADPDEKYFDSIRSRLKDAPTLIITAVTGFAEKGSCINFITRKGKLRFEINMKALKNTGLTASSQLLKLAVIVNGEEKDE